MPPARVCHGSLHGAETSFQLTLALIRTDNFLKIVPFNSIPFDFTNTNSG